MLHSVILAGGSGTRFWPQSRRQLPKQFLHLSGPETLIQTTWSRCRQLVAPDQSWVVTGGSLVAETARQLPDIPGEQILAEPCARSTAPGLALAALHLVQVDPEAIMLVLPADQVIEPAEEFVLAVRQAEQFIKHSPEAFVLFGAPAELPSTRYGYVHCGAEAVTGGARTFRVAGFQEKPTMLEAARYAATGEYYWNCGILVTRAETLLRSLARLSPELHQGFAQMRAAFGGPTWEQTLQEQFAMLPSLAIDRVLLERGDNVYIQEATFAWDDVGTWQALAKLLPRGKDGNSIDGPCCGVEMEGCLVRTTRGHLIATVGVKDLIIIHTPTATLIADKRDETGLRKLISELDRKGWAEYL